MAEIKLASLSKEYLSRRIADVVQLRQAILTWAGRRNQKAVTSPSLL
ncbi:MAG: hypothetical protein J4G05_00795 [Chlorobi bacterium]|nr:hypothetical protein [Chlorobiota bacterium]